MSDENIPLNYPEELHPVYEAIRRMAERVESGEIETRKNINFLLEQQAQTTATVGKVSEKLDRTVDSIAALLAVAEIQAGEINVLSESVKAVDLRERDTDDRLNALINTVERYTSER